MKTFLIFGVFLNLCLAQAGSIDDAVKTELKKLQGDWFMFALEVNGEKIGKDKLQDTFLTIRGKKYITRVKNRTFEATFEIGPKKKPKTINMTPQDGPTKGLELKGIYEFKGDTFRVCRGLQMTEERPKNFRTTVGSQMFVVTWKRQR